MAHQLLKKILIEGKIKALTGLHIGGSNNNIEIGGVDTSVIRNPLTNKPYIPGSSLKGKMRCLLEQTAGIFGKGAGEVKNGPSDDITQPIVKLFGTAKGDTNNIPSKIIVRDADLIDDDNAILNSRKTDLPYTEVKTEVMIDRIFATATPRQIERVPAGVFFKFNMIINIFSDDREKEMVELVFNGMRLLQNDYLGGKGSRGSGQVEFIIERLIERSADFYTKNDASAEKDYTAVSIPKDIKQALKLPVNA